MLGWIGLSLIILGVIHNFILVPMVEQSITTQMDLNKASLSEEMEKVSEEITQGVEDVRAAVQKESEASAANAQTIKDNSTAINALRESVSKNTMNIELLNK